ncbi:hypothetical protein B0J11DRAFT_167651 [Dendryphion nanum]|uniref:Short-chain dehydrogenase/reductase 3 n=1 Tax=Dendryphion nanum TaxID=256645 RepID=A0A9P9EE05_9PLEO|nr:hypothetical protein B0J11DRAFT_167651 [Dendryphion nanum]
MLRFLAVAVAIPLLFLPGPFPIPHPLLLLFPDGISARALTLIRCFSGVFLVHQVNALLNRWAENRWMWKYDGSSWVWEDEIAVVTGGSGGIGAAVVEKLLSYGITVAVLDVEPLSDELQNNATNLVHFYQCDITSRREVHQAGEAIRADHGVPSILINNAGIGNANTILETTPERIRAIFDVNIISHWNTVQEFLPDMIARSKGHIMSTASLASFVGLAGMVDYSCTKAALMAFHEGLTQELKHRYNSPQIKTTIVYPHWTRTRLTAPLEDGIRTTRASIVEPKDVAHAMVRQIIAAKSGQIVLGPGIAASIRAFPMWLQEFLRDRMARVVTVNATTAVAQSPGVYEETT